jgi:branched-chain amino acid transport system substrate-binding protein
MVRDGTVITRRKALASIGAGATFSLAGCSLTGGEGGSGEVTVGVLTARSGAYAALGENVEIGVEMAKEAVNNEGGVNGNDVTTTYEDSELSPGTAVERFDRLVQEDDIDVLTGSVSSAVQNALLDPVAREEVLYLAGIGASRGVTGENCNKYSFLGHHDSESHANGIAEHMDREGYESVSLCYADYAWGQQQSNFVENLFEANGGEVLSSISAPLGSDDYSQYVEQLDLSADCIYIAFGGTDALNFLLSAENFGVETPIVGASGSIGPGVLAEVDGAANGSVFTFYYPEELTGPMDTEGNQEWHNYFKEEHSDKRLTRDATVHWQYLWQVKEAGDAAGYNSNSDVDALTDELRNLEMESSFRFPQGNQYYRAADNRMMAPLYFVGVEDNETFVKGDPIPASTMEDVEVRCDGDW